MSLREFVVSFGHPIHKRLARADEEWLTISKRLQELQEPVEVPSHIPSSEDSGQHPPNNHECNCDATFR